MIARSNDKHGTWRLASSGAGRKTAAPEVLTTPSLLRLFSPRTGTLPPFVRANILLPAIFSVLIGLSQNIRADTEKESCTDSGDTPWLDSSHCYIAAGADNLALWMNSFFGDVHAEQEAPYSTLRLRFDQEWSEDESLDSEIKLRGKVYLPNLNKKISLLFSDNETGTTGYDDLLIDEEDNPDDLTLQYEARKKEFYRVDFRVGLRSSLHPKTSVRYRYRRPLQEDLIGTFSEEALYLGDTGFGSKTRLELDKVLASNKLLQWHNKIEWEEDTPGLQLSTSLALDRKLSSKRALIYFFSVTGETEPAQIVNTYSVGVRYRKNIFREWLFAEIQPSYRWQKDEPGSPRKNAAVILFRLEALFERDFDKRDKDKK